jgi:uncharacterized protein YdeI (YjbR/CyaY-like superfamily)
MNPIFFANANEFREWLNENHLLEKEVLVGYYKIGTQKLSMTWSESVDQALCFGWIDGVRKSIDTQSYCIRFTPRKANSIWSAVNLQKVETLIAQGLMQAQGLAVYEQRKVEKSQIYSYENKPQQLSADLEAIFKANSGAWEFFTHQALSYQKNILFWIMSAKQEATRHSRLEKTIQASAEGKRVL